jgi:hypothetical protein
MTCHFWRQAVQKLCSHGVVKTASGRISSWQIGHIIMVGLSVEQAERCCGTSETMASNFLPIGGRVTRAFHVVFCTPEKGTRAYNAADSPRISADVAADARSNTDAGAQ